MSERKQIYESINNIMLEMKHLAKEQVNQMQKFNFRGIDDVYNALHPLMAKHGIFSTSRIVESSRREVVAKKEVFDSKTKEVSLVEKTTNWVVLRVEYTIHAMDGSKLSTEVEGEAMDSGDKATSKALSMADKYALIQLFKIPTNDEADADKESFIQEREQIKKPRISQEQVNEIEELIRSNNVNELKFLQWLKSQKVNGVYDIPADFYETTVSTIKANIAKMKPKTAKEDQLVEEVS